MLYLKEKGETQGLRSRGRRESSGKATLRPARTSWVPVSQPPLPTHSTRKKNGVTHVFCNSCQSALQCATCIQSTEPPHILPIINIKTRVSWQQIFHSETHFILQSFLVKIKWQRNVIIYSKDFQYNPFQLQHSILPSIQIIVNKHLLHEAYSPSCRNHRHGLASYRKRQRSPETLEVCWVPRQSNSP